MVPTKTLSKAMLLVKWIKSSNIDFSKTQTIDTLHRIGDIPDKKKSGVSKCKLLKGNYSRLPWLTNLWNKWFGNLLFEEIDNSVNDPIFQSILETKNFFKNRSVNMQRKIYRGHRKNLSFTIQGQIWINWKRQQLRIVRNACQWWTNYL